MLRKVLFEVKFLVQSEIRDKKSLEECLLRGFFLYKLKF